MHDICDEFLLKRAFFEENATLEDRQAIGQHALFCGSCRNKFLLYEDLQSHFVEDGISPVQKLLSALQQLEQEEKTRVYAQSIVLTTHPEFCFSTQVFDPLTGNEEQCELWSTFQEYNGDCANYLFFCSTKNGFFYQVDIVTGEETYFVYRNGKRVEVFVSDEYKKRMNIQ